MSVETTTLPRTVQNLIAEVTAAGGEVRFTQPTRFDVVLPCRVVGGEVIMVIRGAVGWYVRDGRNIISGVAAARSEIAYWARQSGIRA
jgi:hypothetical protein